MIYAGLDIDNIHKIPHVLFCLFLFESMKNLLSKNSVFLNLKFDSSLSMP